MRASELTRSAEPAATLSATARSTTVLATRKARPRSWHSALREWCGPMKPRSASAAMRSASTVIVCSTEARMPKQGNPSRTASITILAPLLLSVVAEEAPARQCTQPGAASNDRGRTRLDHLQEGVSLLWHDRGAGAKAIGDGDAAEFGGAEEDQRPRQARRVLDTQFQTAHQLGLGLPESDGIEGDLLDGGEASSSATHSRSMAKVVL